MFSWSFGFRKCVMPNSRAICFARGVQVDADDLVGAHHLGALDHVQADAAQAEHDHVGAGLHLRGEQHRTDAGRHAAADVADLVERRVLSNLGQRDLGHHGVIAERAGAHVVQDRLAVHAETARRIGHQPFALRAADQLAQIGLARQAELAMAAFRRVERNDVIAFFQASSRRGRHRPRCPRLRGRGSPGTALPGRRRTACSSRCGRCRWL